MVHFFKRNNFLRVRLHYCRHVKQIKEIKTPSKIISSLNGAIKNHHTCTVAYERDSIYFYWFYLVDVCQFNFFLSTYL